MSQSVYISEESEAEESLHTVLAQPKVQHVHFFFLGWQWQKLDKGGKNLK